MVQQLAKDRSKAAEVIAPEDGAACFGDSWQRILDAFDNGNAIEWFEEHVMPSKAKFMQYPFNIAKKQGAAALLKDPTICVGTIHSVKGGQADSVYLLPDISRSGAREWMSQGDGRDGIVRTFYVGMTRAKQKLTFCRRWSPASVDLQH